MRAFTASEDEVHSATNRFAAWTVTSLIAVAFIGTAALTPLYVIYKQIYGFTEITLTVLYSVYVLGNLVALMFFGRISDQIGRRRTAIPAIGVAILSTAIFLFATNTAWLFVARILSGFAIGIAAGTGTAWLAELYGSRNRARATVMATLGNLIGLSAGALVAGLLAQYAPWPTRLIFVVYLVVLFALLFFLARTPETVQRPVRSLREVSMQPRLGVPAEIRTRFIAPAVTAFGMFALFGFYAALAPSILAQELHESNRALGGGVVFELCIASTAAVILTRSLSSRTAMLAGLVLLLPSLLLLVVAQTMASLPILLTGTAISGTATALGYRGSLEVVNEIAPADRRAEVVSTYLLCAYVGNSIPIIGVGVLSTFSNQIVASMAFAITIAVFAAVALVTGTRYRAEA
jgi:MFS family permease